MLYEKWQEWRFFLNVWRFLMTNVFHSFGCYELRRLLSKGKLCDLYESFLWKCLFQKKYRRKSIMTNEHSIRRMNYHFEEYRVIFQELSTVNGFVRYENVLAGLVSGITFTHHDCFGNIVRLKWSYIGRSMLSGRLVTLCYTRLYKLLWLALWSIDEGNSFEGNLLASNF